MEEKESSAFQAPENFRVEQRSDIPNPNQLREPIMFPEATVASPMPVSVVMPATEVKKKRGRPRKFRTDGAAFLALSPMPISSSIPLTGEFSAWKQGRPIESMKKSHKYDVFESPGDKRCQFRAFRLFKFKILLLFLSLSLSLLNIKICWLL